jgi:peroxiredoxin
MAIRRLDPRTFIGLGLALLAVVLLGRALLLSHQAATASPAVSSSQSSGSPAPQVGHPAPAATFFDASGQRVMLAGFHGKVVVLNFWYAACDPCQIEMPALQHTYQANQTKGLVVLGADTADDAQTMTDFTHRLGITYPVVRDVDAHTAIAFGVIGTPTSFILDRQGIIRYKITGPVDHDTLVKDVTTLLSRS